MKYFNFFAKGVSRAVLLWIVFSGSAISQTITDGLVAYYPFNGNANDESGNGNHGILHGSSTTFVDGIDEQAIKFDNSNSGTYTVNDWVELPNITINELTVSHWVRYISGSSTSYSGAIYSIGDYPSKLLRVEIRNDGTARAYLHISGTSFVTEWANLSDGEWHLITLTIDSNNMKFYADGLLIGSVNVPAELEFIDEYQQVALHRFNASESSRFTGELDELYIYDRALTVDEIQEYYNLTATPNNSPVAYYPFNGNANDESGNGNHGILHGSSTTFVDGIDEQAIKFDNSNSGTYTVNDWVELPNITINELTVSHWVRYISGSSTSYSGAIYSIGDYPSKLLRVEIKNDGTARAYLHISGTSFVTEWANLSDGEWHLITLTIDSNNMKFYADGLLIGSVNVPAELEFIDEYQQVALHRFNASESSRFTGELDELYIYDRALTVDEIQEYYNLTATPNNSPVAQCKNITKDVGIACEVVVTPDEVDNGSNDPDGDDITLSLEPVGPYPIGENPVTLTVSDGSLSASCNAIITVTGGSGLVAGTVLSNTNALEGVTVKLLDNEIPTNIAAETYADEQGHYVFHDIALNEYQVMIVEPLGYLSEQNFIPTTVECGASNTVDFTLNEIVIVNNARSKGYWKHQFDVYIKDKGKAQETAEQLENYIVEVQERYTLHFNLFGGIESFEDWQGILSVKGNAGMEAKALAQTAALALNIMSLKISQFEVVTDDGYTAGNVLTYVSELILDEDESNDELAKDLAEFVCNQQTITAGIVNPSQNILYKGFENNLDEDLKPTDYALLQNYPNPFNPETKISYSIPKESWVTLKVFDVSGQTIATLVDGNQQSGIYHVTFDAENLTSGIYFYQLKAGIFSQVKRMLLVK